MVFGRRESSGNRRCRSVPPHCTQPPSACTAAHVTKGAAPNSLTEEHVILFSHSVMSDSVLTCTQEVAGSNVGRTRNIPADVSLKFSSAPPRKYCDSALNRATVTALHPHSNSFLHIIQQDRDRLIGEATSYRADGLRFKPRWVQEIFPFQNHPDGRWGPLSPPPVQWLLGFCPWGKVVRARSLPLTCSHCRL